MTAWLRLRRCERGRRGGRAMWRRPWLMAGGLGLLGGAALALFCLLGSGCGTVGYLAQSAHGHLSLLAQARPVDEWLDDPATPETLKTQLALAQRLRHFAVQELALPDNRSYQRYVDLKRPAPVWNVVAAPELSLRLHTWCFPVVGCVGYRGYYRQEEAEAEAQALRAQGLEVSVYAVPAYSTLGKLDLLGGDPLLSSFIHWPEGELARMLFHELAHQVVFAPGDTQFNESYATAVERLGVARWLSEHASPQARQAYDALEQRRSEFRALTGRTRAALETLYASPLPPPAQRERKAELLAAFRRDHAELKAQRWQGFAGYDGFVARANNASLGVQAAYHRWVPAFEALFDAQGRDFKRFHAAVGVLADLSPAERERRLSACMSVGCPP